MSANEKLRKLRQIVADSFCPFDLFCENVLSSAEGNKGFARKFSNCKTEKDIENLVNEYI
jgi:hypothetical protein